MNKAPAKLAFAYRGGIIENITFGHFVITKNKKIVASKGDTRIVAYMRSSSKPIQAMTVILSGAIGKFGVTEKELSIMCASHYAAPYHVDLLRSMLRRFHITEKMLLCGIHDVQDKLTLAKVMSGKMKNSPMLNNCSGKHIGMILASRALGASPVNYIDMGHPVQKMNVAILAKMAELRPSAIKLGMDGCSAPNFALPLYNMALAFENLTNPADLEPELAIASTMITRAMKRHPENIQSFKKFDTELMRANAAAVSKGGAEGVQCVGFLGKHAAYVHKISGGDELLQSQLLASMMLKKYGFMTQKQVAGMGKVTDVNKYNSRHFVIGKHILA